jgi:hypothetical protein
MMILITHTIWFWAKPAWSSTKVQRICDKKTNEDYDSFIHAGRHFDQNGRLTQQIPKVKCPDIIWYRYQEEKDP